MQPHLANILKSGKGKCLYKQSKDRFLRPSSVIGSKSRHLANPLRLQSSLGHAASLWNFTDTVMRQAKLPVQNVDAKSQNQKRSPGFLIVLFTYYPYSSHNCHLFNEWQSGYPIYNSNSQPTHSHSLSCHASFSPFSLHLSPFNTLYHFILIVYFLSFFVTSQVQKSFFQSTLISSDYNSA